MHDSGSLRHPSHVTSEDCCDAAYGPERGHTLDHTGSWGLLDLGQSEATGGGAVIPDDGVNRGPT